MKVYCCKCKHHSCSRSGSSCEAQENKVWKDTPHYGGYTTKMSANELNKNNDCAYFKMTLIDRFLGG